MKYALGIDVGSTWTTASLVLWQGVSPESDAKPVLALRVPSVVYVDNDGDMLVGAEAERAGERDPSRVIREFAARVGDSVPFFLAGWSAQAENVLARVIEWIVDSVTVLQKQPPERITVTHPESWGSYKQLLLSRSIALTGVDDVTLISEPLAAARATVLGPEVRDVAVYDLGGGSFEATVLRRRDETAFEVIGVPQSVELGGCDFDQAVLSRVLADPGRAASHGTPEAMQQLRQACTDAVRTLSLSTECSVAVGPPTETGRARRLIRAEFEELIQDHIHTTVEATQRAIGSAGLEPADIGALILVGGSARIPLVTQMLSAAFDRPVLVDADPHLTVAQGAAQLAADHVASLLVQEAGQDLVLPANDSTETAPTAAQLDGAEPVAKPDELERHRHRRRQRRYWVRSTVLVASLVGLMLAGPSLAAPESNGLPVPQLLGDVVPDVPFDLTPTLTEDAADPSGTADAPVSDSGAAETTGALPNNPGGPWSSGVVPAGISSTAGTTAAQSTLGSSTTPTSPTAAQSSAPAAPAIAPAPAPAPAPVADPAPAVQPAADPAGATAEPAPAQPDPVADPGQVVDDLGLETAPPTFESDPATEVAAGAQTAEGNEAPLPDVEPSS